jgi:predicted Zn-dependent protease
MGKHCLATRRASRTVDCSDRHTSFSCRAGPGGVIQWMARTPSIGELLLGGVIVALVGFVGSQVLASPRRTVRELRSLTSRDSVAIVTQYRSQIASRGDQYSAPGWLTHVHIARLEAAAQRDVRGTDRVSRPSPDSLRALLASLETGSYLSAMLAEDGGIVSRWKQRAEPIRVWVQPQSSEAGFSSDLIGPTRRAFTAWNDVDIGVAFELVDDSTQADVHVTWRAKMPKPRQLGTTFRMTGGAGWIAFAHVQLSTAYDIYTVQNAARHEAGHVLGLDHSPVMQDIMAAETEGRRYELTDRDRATALALYQLPPGRIPSQNR